RASSHDWESGYRVADVVRAVGAAEMAREFSVLSGAGRGDLHRRLRDLVCARRREAMERQSFQFANKPGLMTKSESKLSIRASSLVILSSLMPSSFVISQLWPKTLN